jgi:hypothetical protein
VFGLLFGSATHFHFCLAPPAFLLVALMAYNHYGTPAKLRYDTRPLVVKNSHIDYSFTPHRTEGKSIKGWWCTTLDSPLMMCNEQFISSAFLCFNSREIQGK